MNPADKQGQNGTNGSTSGSNLGSSGMEPTTPAVGASSSTADPMASGIGIDDTATRSGPDLSESSAATGSSMSQGSFNAGSTGSAGAMGASSGTSGSGGIKDQALEQATKLRDRATERARSAAEQGKTRTTETIDNLARAAHDAAGSLEEQVGPQIGQYAHRAADALDQLSDSLRNKSVDELLDDARNFARRSPAVAIGAAVAVGFALSRFLKATSSSSTGSYQRNAYALDDEDDDMPGLSTTRTGGSTQPRYNA